VSSDATPTAPSWVAPFFDVKGRAHGPSGVLDHHVERARAIARFGGCGSGRVLELGAGAGGSAAATADLGHEVVAVELSPVRAAYAREVAADRPRLRVEEADFMTWTAPDPSYDAVVLWNGFGVGADSDQRALLRRIAGWVAADGVVLLDVFHPAGWLGAAGHDEPDEETGVRERVTYDHVASRFVDAWWFDGPDAAPLSQSARCYAPADLALLVDGTGLVVEALEVDGGTPPPAEDPAWADVFSYRVRLRRDA
jgi:SAM-dependent methyltransferase